MLRRHAEQVGLTSNFTILDTDDQLRLLKQVMEAERVDTKRWAPQALMAVIQRWKDRGLTPARVTPHEDTDFAAGRARALYARLSGAAALAERGGFRRPAAAHDRAAARAAGRPGAVSPACSATSWWTNTRTPTWCSISGCACSRRATGTSAASATTTSRSIRGAAPRWRTSCASSTTFPGAKIVRLEANYRSTAPILAAASALIAHNEGRLGKTLRPGRQDATGERVTVVGLWDSDEEARMVGDRIEALRRDGEPLAEMAILVRAGFQTRAFEERLITLGMPYRVVGGLRFYERQEIRDAIAYMRLVVQPADDLAFERIVNVPRRGVGEVALRTMHETARADGVPLMEAAAKLVASGGLKGRVKEQVDELLRGFARWRAMLENGRPCGDGRHPARRKRLHGHVAAGQIARSTGAAGEPEGTGSRAGRLRDAGRLPRPRVAGDGERRSSRRRPGQPDDAARREGAGVRHGVPAGLGGGAVPQPARAGRGRREVAGGGAAARLCRA